MFTCVVLFFFPERGIVNQIEVNGELKCKPERSTVADEPAVLSFVGGVLGIGLSCGILAVASYCGSHYGADSPEARGILAAGFVVLAFIGEHASLQCPRPITDFQGQEDSPGAIRQDSMSHRGSSCSSLLSSSLRTKILSRQALTPI